jgi:hypothetical protein
VTANPVAVTGNSGNATAQSSATNTGWTGAAFSQAVSNPVALSGRSGATGPTGAATSSPAAVNTAILGIAIALGRL